MNTKRLIWIAVFLLVIYLVWGYFGPRVMNKG